MPHTSSHDDVPQSSRRRVLTGLGAAAAGAGVLAVAGAPDAAATVDNGTYYSISPERVLDTRNGGGPIRGGQTRTDDILSGEGIAVVCNVTVVNTVGVGYLAVFNADGSRPNPYSTVNWSGARQIVANLTVLELGNSGFSVYCGGGATAGADYLIDLLGFFETPVEAARSARARRFEDSVRRKLGQQR